MMRLIAETLGHWELFAVRRFDAEWERDASLGLRRGERAAWPEYDAHGRARGGSQDKAQAEAVALWLADYLLGRDALLLAGSNDEAAELARQARQRLVKLGQVPARPEVHLSDGNGAAVGDVVRATLNTNIPAEAGDALTNRDTLRLAGFGGQAPYRYALAERKTPEVWTRPFPVPVSYLENHAELAYAGNVAVSQGRTVDVAHLLVSPTLSRVSFYVGMTRGRLANTAHVVTGPPQPRTGDPLPQAEVEAVVADILATESASLTATEVMRQGQDAPVNSRHVFAMWSVTTRAAAYAAIDAGLRDRAAELGRAQAVRPEPWLLRHLGPPPGPDASAALRADYELRAAVAASYREAAGITDPNVSLGEVPRGVPGAAVQAARAASRDAAGVLEARAEAVAEASGAWVPGREAPGYEAAPAPEAEAELLSG